MKILPSMSEIGTELESKGLVRRAETRPFLQTGSNCFEIAEYLAKKFGSWVPNSRARLQEIYWDLKRASCMEEPHSITDRRNSPFALVIREPEVLSSEVHVTFEAYGREYNYGYGVSEGFSKTLRIPLGRAFNS